MHCGARRRWRRVACQRFIVERVLDPADHSVTAVYDRATYREEKRATLKALEETVCGSC